MFSKKNLLTLHKILGLASGLVVFVVAVTGCCWVFKDEIEPLLFPMPKISPAQEQALMPTQVQKTAQAVFPKNSIHGVLYQATDQPIEVIFYDAEPEFYQSVFLDPYSGEVLASKDHFSGFFGMVLQGHVRLWLPKEIGEEVVAVSVLVFVVLLLSGFVLWLPKKWKNIKKRMTFSWKPSTRWKRKNYDLHSILGFYTFLFAFILAFTGLIMAYDWVDQTFYTIIGGDKQAQFIWPEHTGNAATGGEQEPIDRLIPQLQKEYPDAASFELHYPQNPQSTIYVEVSRDDGVYYNNDYRFYDPNTLDEIHTASVYGPYEKSGFADTLKRMNYDIHVGAIGGLAGKILAFCISLAIATLPVTGFLLWYGRTYKKKKK